MQSLSSRIQSDNNVVQLYEWADRSPSAVLKCTCLQVSRIKTLSSLSHAIGGQNLFLHYETPGLFAEVCGMIVGVIPKEDQVTYEVDDGTSVLRIVENRKSLRQAESQSTHTTVSATTPSGVPECYILPPQVKASTSTHGYGSSLPVAVLAPLNPRFEVADTVKCTGKIHVDRDGNRFLVAKQMALCEDVNAESLHQVNVINLENDLYRKAFDWTRVTHVKKDPARGSEVSLAAQNTSARLLLIDPPSDDMAMPAPLIGVEQKDDTVPERQRLSHAEARKFLSSDAPFPSPSSARSIAVSSSSSTRTGERSRPSQTSPRQLRSHDKIADRKLTESYFQLQLQHYIKLRYRCDPFMSSDLWSDAALASLARRLVRLRMQHRLSSRSSDLSRRSSSRDTREQHQDKVRRLFEWAIRKMMQDGFLSLSEPDRRRPASMSGPISSPAAEWYQLVTPEFLVKPLSRLLRSGQTGTTAVQDDVDVDHLTARLRILDDRFRYVSRSLVRDGLALYNARNAPIVID